MIIRAYLRASTKEQNANRAREQLMKFAEDHGTRITTYYVENASGTNSKRPELQRLLSEAADGDVLLVEAIDRLSRLDHTMWEALKRQIEHTGLQIVAVDLPVTHSVMKPATGGIEAWLHEAIRRMFVEFMAAVSRKTWEDNRRRQAEGIATAKKEGRLKPRQPNLRMYARIIELRKSFSIRKTAELVGCSKGTVERAQSWARENEPHGDLPESFPD
ncbi:recombinase family protein [Pseudomonas syringae group genomosp. 3]|uniref:recombinase family protein n=1 Tax=Pseudomonas syringae group genomosp. 3 TaxID=251701 RepID=UPI0006B965BF|nr:recombinase family protein [Pseudomonas syringae group genomosp. 3]